ncbi:7-deoxyloganetin glucosyltransferase [Amborella trichopoda]|uniref:Glycosyltransferase n=1 Tax=Amborella trichopoda TaxID=13333 RepID=U5CXJ9_AMBTC|nr:7-deoxyloganetin glucosyltransferase [Amborella trichopoda]ERN14685.1 hypothetical protein AMTR_s00038p00217680 [Amborella trichopoda]|eukprot:XP_006853218.1 7-deoxyloganetin glucosyltransferase [Amborella trichopoda]
MGSDYVQKPHAVCVPFPAQGHITPMMQLAKLLHARGFHITFVNNEYNHKRLLKSRGSDPSMGVQGFVFESIPDGVPPIEIEATQSIPELCYYTRFSCLDPFRELVARLNSSEDLPPVSCVISDGVMNFTQTLADELGIPRVAFWTTSACGLWAYLQYPELIERGYTPLKDASQLTNGYLETPLNWIQSMPSIRLRDMPSFLRTTDTDDIMLNFVNEEPLIAIKSTAVILNTFDSLEQPVLDTMRAKVPTLYTVGQLSMLCKRAITDSKLSSIDSSLWTPDASVLDWLDNKPAGSVVYVNFGSITIVTPQQLEEFAWGLANSGLPFVWIIRPDLVRGEGAMIPEAFVEDTKERSLLASWCDQERVLQHPAVGGFLTHSGWNSTIESLSGGVPMICWPFFAEQQTNCFFACTEWGVGMEIDNNVKREEVEAQVRELMKGEKGKEMREKAMKWKEESEKAIQCGGSSLTNLDALVNDVLFKKSRA